MEDLYVVFDKIPTKKDGGLVATYVDFVRELSSEYSIKFVSVFRSEPSDIPEFQGLEIITLFDAPIDNRFYRAPTLLANGKIREGCSAFLSALRFFACIPFGRSRAKRLLFGKRIVAVAPAAAMFLSSALKYILEIHTNFEYFWGRNNLGRAQAALIPPAELTVFRNKCDAEKGMALFPSTYMYNTFNAEHIRLGALPTKLSHRALFVGRLVSQKNPFKLLDCARLVHERIEDFVLDIYGEGELRAQLEQRIDDLGLNDVVRLRGFTNDKAVYQGYDLLWLTSEYEGFGLVIIEAAANMVPTVTTNWGSAVSEVVIDGETGYIAEDINSFVSRSCDIMHSLDLRNKLASNALRNYNNRFSPETHKERWLQLLDSVYSK